MLLCCYLQCFDTVGWVTGRPSGLSKPILLAPTGSSQYRENENRELTIQDRFAWKMTSGCRLLPFTVLFNSRDCVAVLYDNSVSSLNCNWNQADPNQQEHNQVIWELERLYEFPLYHPSLVSLWCKKQQHISFFTNKIYWPWRVTTFSTLLILTNISGSLL